MMNSAQIAGILCIWMAWKWHSWMEFTTRQCTLWEFDVSQEFFSCFRPCLTDSSSQSKSYQANNCFDRVLVHLQNLTSHCQSTNSKKITKKNKIKWKNKNSIQTSFNRSSRTIIRIQHRAAGCLLIFSSRIDGFSFLSWILIRKFCLTFGTSAHTEKWKMMKKNGKSLSSIFSLSDFEAIKQQIPVETSILWKETEAQNKKK